MKKFLIIVSSLLLLASCGSATQSDMAVTTETKTTQNGTTFDQDLASTSSKITNTEEFQSCMKQNTNMCIQTVGMEIARKTKDASFCKELRAPDQQSGCEFAIAMINATEKNDEKACDVLTNETYLRQCKVSVYRQEASAKQDPKLCEKIATTIIASGTGMEMQANNEKDQCTMMILMNGTGTTAADCENLENTSSVEICKNNIKNRPAFMAAPNIEKK